MKRQARITNIEVDRLWRAFYAVLAYEDIGLEKDSLESVFYYDFDRGVLCLPYLIGDFRKYLEKEYRGRIQIIEDNECGDPYTLESLSDRLASISLEVSRGLYFGYLSGEAREFALILPYEINELIILEGERDEIRLISFPSFLFFHSHPVGGCLPSKADLLSLVEFILNGGQVYGIISSECLMAIYRRWPLSEDDIVNLFETVRHMTRDEKRVLLTLKNKEGKVVINTLFV